ncbi:hypothetical protein GGTG_01961 [Gaeumannomyces tritici R3-111a-1]|uniref:Uncharacterized protein n=1 Tax=Gaeumannomyces tritici (strain R3-111a-1) TaxID=644352 RepID=J3NL20_GAET3|nr:hypothetical protein GGTG_01961 [Gaeumannomyces tritici R3-111a-1]EJT81987.1 hypothetical protein GGTG_01961 [Gaeumannomyces tritici R3-111a-1]
MHARTRGPSSIIIVDAKQPSHMRAAWVPPMTKTHGMNGKAMRSPRRNFVDFRSRKV